MYKLIRQITIVLLFTLLIAACNLPARQINNVTPSSPTSTLEVEEVANLPVEVSPPANTDGAETVFVPGGVFWMGSPDTDEDANEDEMPYHQVTQSGFYIYTHEVTNEMYAACVEARACLPIQIHESGTTTHYDDPAYADYPVVGVDWLMANDYCEWANSRLPTEAEWELASRGTQSFAFPWGVEEATCDRVNMLGCAAPADVVKVGSYLLGNSPYEAWDLSGNVWEWTNDWYDEDYYNFSALIDPIGPYYSELKVARGGGLFSEPEKMRSAERAGVDPHRAYDDVGFRCVPTGLQLPEEFTVPKEEHIWSPSDPLDGGGDRLDDPDGEPSVPPEEEDDIPWVSIGYSAASCPSPDGRIHLFLEVDCSEEVTYEVTLEDIPYDCVYDEVLRGLHCEGPIPENNEELSEYHVLVHVPGFGIGHYYIDRPLDCPIDTIMPDDMSISMSCADIEGWVLLEFYLSPPVIWDRITYEGGELSCEMTAPGRTVCLLPDEGMGSAYNVQWEGHDESGGSAVAGTFTILADNCRVEANSQSVDPSCFEGHPMVQVMYLPEDRVLAEVSQDGRLLDCIGMAPGVQVCGNLVGSPGSVADISYCFEGDACYSGAITYPNCGSDLSWTLNPTCYENLGAAVVLTYEPAEELLTSANLDGVGLTCYDAPEPGYYMCTGLPDSPGSSATFTFVLSDGSSHFAIIEVPDCAEDSQPAGFWNLVDVNCFHISDIYTIIDTPMSELVAGVEFNYNVQTEDGATTYTCELHPTIAGRIFCWGEPPAHNSPLQVCVSTPGVDEICTSFTDFWIRTPVCEEEPTEEPVEQDDPGDEPIVDCSTYGSPITCNADPNCVWRWTITNPSGSCRVR